MARALDKRQATLHYLQTLTLAIVVFVLEALPLQIALGQEFSANRWISELLHVDLSMAVNGDRFFVDRSTRASTGSILVASVIIGKVQYYKTRTPLMATITFFFDATFVGRLIYHSCTRFLLLRRVWRYQMEGMNSGPQLESPSSGAETLRSGTPDGDDASDENEESESDKAQPHKNPSFLEWPFLSRFSLNRA